MTLYKHKYAHCAPTDSAIRRASTVSALVACDRAAGSGGRRCARSCARARAALCGRPSTRTALVSCWCGMPAQGAPSPPTCAWCRRASARWGRCAPIAWRHRRLIGLLKVWAVERAARQGCNVVAQTPLSVLSCACGSIGPRGAGVQTCWQEPSLVCN